jgi:hypothetical protein
MAHKSDWATPIAVGAIVGILSMFRTFRLLMVLIIGVSLAMFLWDKVISQSTLPESQYEFSVDEPILNEMSGDRPAEFSPMFDMNWTFENKSREFIQTFQLNGELYRCDTLGQPLSSCDYVSRFNHRVVISLPAGRRYSAADRITFTNPTRKAGIYRARIWASDVIADSDREY